MTVELGLQLEEGTVVQIDPEHDPRFGCAFMIVSEVSATHVLGYVPMGLLMSIDEPDACAQNSTPQSVSAFYRAPFSAIEPIGLAVWAMPNDLEKETEDV